LADRFICEREYLRSEFDRSRPIGLLVVGMLLGFAFGRHLDDRRFDDLVARLDRR
jgi:hypothetical protein